MRAAALYFTDHGPRPFLSAGVALLCWALASACHSDSTGPSSVASVTVTSPNDTLLVIGAFKRLSATARDASGATVSSATCEWFTTDPAKGTVDQSGTVAGVATGSVTFSAVCGGASGTLRMAVTVVPVRTVTISPAGDTLLYETGVAQLAAVLKDSTGAVLTGRAVTWSTSDPALVSVSAAGLVTGVLHGMASITATSESKAGTITIRVAPIPVARVTVTATGLTALYAPGGTVQLSAVALDSLDRPLAGRAVTWSSQAAGAATVDQNGLVTSVAAGLAPIQATIDGKVGSIDLTLLNAPVADWSGAGEWVSLQGDSAHTGFVRATADPRTFRELWTTTVAANVVLNPAVAGGARVFTSTAAYFGTNLLVALDGATGSLAWSHDFGNIHAVHQPAFGASQVFVTTSGQSDSYLYAFDAASGAQNYRSAYGNQWEHYYAPVILGGQVYMAGGTYGGMYRFDAVTGAQGWFVSTNQYDQWTPAVTNGSVYAYTGSYTPQVTVVDAATGAVSYNIPDPSFSWNGWSMNVAPALGGSHDLLATQGGRLISFDLQGRSVGWQLTAGFNGNVTIAAGNLYVMNGATVDVRSEADGSLLWSWAPPDGSPTNNVVVTQNLLFVSTATHTYALDLGAKAAVWSYSAGGWLSLSGQGRLFVARADGKLSAIALK